MCVWCPQRQDLEKRRATTINSYVDLDEHATVEENKKYLIKTYWKSNDDICNAKVCTVQVFVEFYKMLLVVIAVAVDFDLVYKARAGRED